LFSSIFAFYCFLLAHLAKGNVSQVLVHLAKQFQRRFLKICQSETGIACGSHVCYWIGTK
jgi:hypothetical protein